MKALSAALAAAVFCAASPSGAAAVTGAALAQRCAADRSICDKAVTWIYANTGACSDSRLAHTVVVDKVGAWLKAHPKQTAEDDNTLAAAAIEALWPCQ
ncbi:MAG: Rap1a/Tai family immunity protein [Rhizomicrobium sp.]